MQIILADDEPDVRSALKFLLEQERGLTVVGEASEAEALLEEVREKHPDVVLLGWELVRRPASGDAVGSSARVLASMRLCCPHLRVIVMSGRPEERVPALMAGADAFVSKGDPPQSLLGELHAVDMSPDRRGSPT